MAMPDIGLAPPPPPDVSAQLRPSDGATGGAAPNLASILSGLAGGGPPPLQADLTPKIMEVQPLLTQLARQVPAMGPDVDRLNVELQSRMGGLPAALSGLSQQPMPQDMGMGTPMGPGPGAMGPPPPVGPPPPTGNPMALPSAPSITASAMDTAMQLEIKLPPLGKDDSTLMPYIQGFIARMRDEVPKVVEGETESINPPVQQAPTESMLSKIPGTF